jgi:mRNA-degrading endonuclease RelE of RelBE toxin-antitoxin system
MYRITYSDRFLKSFNRLTNDEQLTFENKMWILIIWYYANHEIIVLIDVGHHDILKKYKF